MARYTKRVIIPFAESDLEAIEEFQHANRLRSRAATIRRLIALGARSSRPNRDLASTIQTLREHWNELEVLGVVHAAVFGSVARGDAKRESDTDILIEFGEEQTPDLFHLAGIYRRIGDFLSSVDVVEKDSLRKEIKDRVLSEAVYAF